MKSLKNIITSMVAIAAIAVSAHAGTVTITVDEVNYGTDGGGAYILNSATLSNVDYSGAAKVGSGFLSFCLEKDEQLSNGGVYTYEQSYAAKNGGVNVQPKPGTDPISVGTAYLYSQFAQGLLAISYTKPGYALLQDAIWILEGEKAGVNALVTWVQNNIANYSADANGAYNVFVLNLTQGSNLKQDQLYYRVPEHGMTIALLGMALMSIVGIRRFVKQS